MFNRSDACPDPVFYADGAMGVGGYEHPLCPCGFHNCAQLVFGQFRLTWLSANGEHSAGLGSVARGGRDDLRLDGARSRAPESQQSRYFNVARQQIAPYQNQRKNPGDGVFPHVNAINLSGHTPGHTGYLLESGGEALLLWGDICHVPDIQVRRPEVTMAFDTDPQAAIATRKRAFDMAVADKLLVAGVHLHFPGFSYMAREGGGYRMIPESWRFEG